ncbi:MotE family protein [Niveispirillum irakense]|uniref:MotE family protein n=1 Tax=Niveispirillum irakense TaxID=34011 RepID=UPI00040B2D2E|nr:hypothetical protein [Niveispirillum irakense]
MAFDPAKLMQRLLTRPRLLPTAIAICAIAVPVYALAVVNRMNGSILTAAVQDGGNGGGATATTPPPGPKPLDPPGKLPAYTDMLNTTPPATGWDAPPMVCDPGLAELLTAERKALAARQAELDLRAQMLAAAEKKAAAQVTRLEQAARDVGGLLDRRASMAKADLQRLVSIYENMKPKDAARLLNETDPEILVDLLDLMQERRSAPILAEMDARKVNALTRTLAERRVLPADRPGGARKNPPQTASLPE